MKLNSFSLHFKGNDGCVPNSVRFKFGVENLQTLRSSRVPERLAPSVLPSTKEIHMGNSTTNFRKSTPISAWRLVGNGNPINPIDVSTGNVQPWHDMPWYSDWFITNLYHGLKVYINITHKWHKWLGSTWMEKVPCETSEVCKTWGLVKVEFFHPVLHPLIATV